MDFMDLKPYHCENWTYYAKVNHKSIKYVYVILYYFKQNLNSKPKCGSAVMLLKTYDKIILKKTINFRLIK